MPSSGHVFEDVLDLVPDRWEPTFGQLVEFNGQIGAGKEGGSGLSCLGVTLFGPSEDDISSTQSRVALGQCEQGPACPDLDVVRVRADRQDRQRPLRRLLECRESTAPIRSCWLRCRWSITGRDGAD